MSTKAEYDAYNMNVEEIRGNFFKKLREKEKEFCSAIERVWLTMFDKNIEVVNDRYETVYHHLSSLYDEMLEEEEAEVQDLRKCLENLIAESEALKTELSLNIQLPFKVDINGTGIKLQKEDLEEFLEKYKKIRNERILLLKDYLKQENDLCDKLGANPFYHLFNEVPSESKLEEIKIYLRDLEKEKEKRYAIYVQTASEIDELMEQLEISRLSSFEKMALDKEKEFQLSEKNMEMLKEWKNRLVDRVEEQNELITQLKDKVGLLWDRLDIDHEEREKFIVRTAKKSNKSVLKEYRDELERCEELKKANIETVILRLRNDIVDLWDRCHISEEERNAYTDFVSTDFNEELLESHEREVSQLTKFYEETSNLYSLAEKWFELWNKMLLLENQSNNIERLNNRGGQLLKEERERKQIQKELPKVEAKLEKLVKKFEVTHNKPFLYNGMPLMVMISEYWDNRRMEKENEKEVRKVQNATSKVTPLKHVNRTQTTTSTSSAISSRKRVRPLTPVENVPSQKQTVRRQLKMTKSKTDTVNRRRSRSHDPAARYGSNLNLRSNSANSSVVSYAGFQNYIETRSKVKTTGMPLRSSLSPSRPGVCETGTKNALYRTPSSIITPIKRSRLQTTYSASKLPRLRPMIN
ncbi:protein regulator of cytokinesis 1-like isoform X2 [Planococcus citri]|uniref:protein regulator of cytokinesis 1-like isoform X2 n=1 Tax=Planococcus citri TaxID=170843 RepID=UPI0031FA132F